ncbi:DHHC palmitoyltransferase-domain-containing protein [Cyathus striatus]|nr:DHHC palmitoyltransferase-domain-containing protein [Cyathus striatus]
MLPPKRSPPNNPARPHSHNFDTEHQGKCCGVVEEAAYNVREKRAKAGPQPWIVLKLMVPITLGIIGYATYVYIARLCVRMIRRENGAPGSRGTGIALVAVYSVLLLWALWAYLKVILTPPGFARDVRPSPSPPSYLTPTVHPKITTTLPPPGTLNTNARHSRLSLNIPRSPLGALIEEPQQEAEEERQGETQAGVLDAIPIPGRSVQPQPQSDAMSHKTLKKQKKKPPSGPILHPAHRYCTTDEIVKPYRAHHCRSCGTVRIGQCVGARNQKFFLNFCQAASVYSLYIFGTLLAYTVLSARSTDENVDPQEIVILALSALFSLFTTTLQISHVRQIWLNQTTVESVQIRSMKERETTALQSAFGFCNPSAKTHTRKEWDAEWGALNTEGNIWWLGNGSRNWTDVMGRNKLGWILPIGRSLSDG